MEGAKDTDGTKVCANVIDRPMGTSAAKLVSPAQYRSELALVSTMPKCRDIQFRPNEARSLPRATPRRPLLHCTKCIRKRNCSHVIA